MKYEKSLKNVRLPLILYSGYAFQLNKVVYYMRIFSFINFFCLTFPVGGKVKLVDDHGYKFVYRPVLSGLY